MARKMTPFAHLLGVAAAALTGTTAPPAAAAVDPAVAAAALAAARLEADDKDDDKDDDKPARKDGESDDDYAKRCKAKGAKAEGPKDGGSGDDENDDKAKTAAFGERARCARIVAHGVAVGAVHTACSLAFDTDMSVDHAVATIDGTLADRTPAPRAPGLSARMAAEPHVPTVRPDAAADPSTVAGTVEATVAMARAALDKAQGRMPAKT